MEFGVFIRSGQTYQAMLELSQHSEELGYSHVFINDHVHGFADKGKEPYLEAWTVMSGIGVQTSKIKIGQIVLFNSLRNPAYLAKSIATLDNMTNGRYEIMIGAGWNKPEYEGYDLMEKGRGMPSAKERVDRFEESLYILRGLLNNEEFSYKGKFWNLKNAINIPQPVKPLRISVGASKPRMIRITAKLADGLNLGSGLFGFKKGLEILTPALEKNNKSINDYYCSSFSTLKIVKNNEEYEKEVKIQAEKSKKSVEEIKESSFIGPVEIIVDKLRKAEKLGIKLLIFSPQPATTQDERISLLNQIKDEIISELN